MFLINSRLTIRWGRSSSWQDHPVCVCVWGEGVRGRERVKDEGEGVDG